MRPTHIVDLSRSVGADTQVVPGHPVPQLTSAASVESDGCSVTRISLGSHTGTHVDAPCHFRAGGAPIDELDPGLFVGTGVVVDVSGHGDRQPITWNDIEPWADRLVPGTIVLLHTGWPRHYRTERYFAHPHLDGEAAVRLLELGVRTIGVDAPSPDFAPAKGEPGDGAPVHHTVADAGGVLVENLCRLEEIDFPDPLISVLPIKLAGSDGAPVRAVAMRFES